MVECGIIYKCFQLSEELFILYPIELKDGMTCNGHFYTDTNITFNNVESLKTSFSQYIADGITTPQILNDHFGADGDLQLAKDYYFAMQSTLLSIVRIKNGEVEKRKISIPDLFKSDTKEIYETLGLEPQVTINQALLNKILNENSIDEIKMRLTSLQQRIGAIKEAKERKVDKMEFTNENVKIHLDPKVKINQKPQIAVASTHTTNTVKDETIGKPWFTIADLRDYLNDRILGHEEEIKKVATIVYNNYKAHPEDTILSMLIPGPTGSGKTVTARSVCEFLKVPFAEIDCTEIVPNGIVGPKLEDKMLEIAREAQFDPIKMAKAVMIIDEFDKIALTGLDLKVAARYELLKFVEGKKYSISVPGSSSKTVILDTARTMKFFLGAFTDCLKEDKVIGFGGSPTPINSEEDLEKKILTNTQFEKELLSRIQVMIPYKALTEEDKKNIILHGKNSMYGELERRFLRDYGIQVVGAEDFAKGVLEALKDDESVRVMNNIILAAFLDALYEVGINEGKYHRLVLTKDSASKKTFDLS